MMKCNKICVAVALFFIQVYQVVLSPLKVPCCRYQPTCSQYAKDAFLLHGVRKGAILTLKRLLKCHPWGGSGYDPVPVVVKNNLKSKEK